MDGYAFCCLLGKCISQVNISLPVSEYNQGKVPLRAEILFPREYFPPHSHRIQSLIEIHSVYVLLNNGSFQQRYVCLQKPSSSNCSTIASSITVHQDNTLRDPRITAFNSDSKRPVSTITLLDQLMTRIDNLR